MARKSSLPISDKDFAKMKIVKNKKNYTKKGVHFYLSLKTRILVRIIIIALLLGLSYIFLNESFSIKTKNELTYNENGGAEYKIQLKENNPYNQEYLEQGSYAEYISTLIDKINARFNYDFFLSKPMTYSYTYRIDADIYVNNKESGNTMFHKNYVVLDKKTINNKNSNKVSIDEKVDINYAYYNEVASEFKQKYELNVDSILKVRMYVDFIGMNDEVFEYAKSKNAVVEVDIPLLEQGITINANNENLNNTSAFEEVSDSELINEILLYTGIICIVAGVLLLLNLIIFIIKVMPKKTKYCRIRDGILKDYDGIIVNSKRIPEIVDQKIIDCYSFDELLDAEKTTNEPIVYCEVVRNQKSVFIIITDKAVYRYILKECDLEF